MVRPETPGSDNDYGYDFTSDEERQLIQLAAQASARLSREASVSAGSLVPVGYESGHETGRRACPPSRGACPVAAPAAPDAAQWFLPPTAVPGAPVCYPDLRGALSKLGDDSGAADSDGQSESADDDRSPLQRYRSFPRKPLTVSDLTSGAWCELQHWYTLTRLPGGRRTRTAAMKQGSRVHQKLEDEIYTRVNVEVASREDAFALRLWNVVQGLRTLRETGLTRELEVWGVVDGNVVNGVIDVVSHENPNPQFEEELSSQGSQREARQSALTDYFPPEKTAGHGALPKIYLTDVKTRASTAPVSTVLLRPAMIQLLLYHRFLSDAAAGRLDLLAVFSRYGLDPDRQLSDAFLAQIGDLHEEVFYDAPSSPAAPEGRPGADSDVESGDGSEAVTQSSSGGNLKYRTLREVSSLVHREIALAFPDGQDSLGHILHVQYIHRDDGRALDMHDFPVSRQALDDYLERYMAWWRGEREARGVDIEEAFKCRSCEFAADCSWRQAMDKQWVRRAQRRLSSRRQAG